MWCGGPASLNRRQGRAEGKHELVLRERVIRLIAVWANGLSLVMAVFVERTTPPCPVRVLSCKNQP